MNPSPSSGTGLSVSCVSAHSSLELVSTTVFERDLRRVRKQGKDLDKLEAIVEILQPDWLLLYRQPFRSIQIARRPRSGARINGNVPRTQRHPRRRPHPMA